RILGEVKREYAELLARADAIFIDELRKADLYDATSQAFAVFPPVKSVGVVGDARAYEWVIALRAVETVDFMTAHWAHLPYDFLGTVSNRIINELRGVSRVVYDISGKPPATIEWEGPCPAAAGARCLQLAGSMKDGPGRLMSRRGPCAGVARAAEERGVRAGLSPASCGIVMATGIVSLACAS